MPISHPRPRAAFPILAATLALAACAAPAGEATPSTPATATVAPAATADATPEAMASPSPEPEDAAPPADATRLDGDATIELQASTFSETAIVVAAGTMLTFVNLDGVTHTVTEGDHSIAAAGARFNAVLKGGESVEIAFDEPGPYQVTCLPHSQMNMTVWVEE